jgi:uncharacterized protein YfdQ (DUF2303 family)
MSDKNEAQTIAELTATPTIEFNDGMPPLAFIPTGEGSFRMESLEKMLPTPMRKACTVKLHDLESFIDVVKRQGSLTYSNIYLDVDYGKSQVQAVAIFNDHSDKDETATGWRDHRAVFNPRWSEEWNRWVKHSGNAMSQVELANFLEKNIGDIVGNEVNKMPTGSEVLTFVSALTETRKVKYGSAVNLQNGMVQIEFVEDGDNNTKGKLDMFREFAIGIRPFHHGQAYEMKAFLRYRIDRNSGEIRFWFELQRADKVLEDACADMISKIKAEAGVPVLFGTPE